VPPTPERCTKSILSFNSTVSIKEIRNKNNNIKMSANPHSVTHAANFVDDKEKKADGAAKGLVCFSIVIELKPLVTVDQHFSKMGHSIATRSFRA
jgi:hypothetical protein